MCVGRKIQWRRLMFLSRPLFSHTNIEGRTMKVGGSSACFTLLAIIIAIACFLSCSSRDKIYIPGRRRASTKTNGFGLGLLPRDKRPFLFPFLDKQWCNVFENWHGCLCKEEQLRQAIEEADGDTTIHICFDTYIAARSTPINVDGKSLRILCDRYNLLMGYFDWHVHCKLGGLYLNQVFEGAPRSLHFENFKFADGVSNGDGGVVSFTAGNVSFDTCAFEGNKATKNGGAIAMKGEGALDLHNVQFISNSARTGGGIYVANKVQVTANDVVFEANVAIHDGGAIAVDHSAVDLMNSTFIKNKAIQNGNDFYVLDSARDSDGLEEGTTSASFVKCQSSLNGNTFCDGLSGILNSYSNGTGHNITDCIDNGLTEGTTCELRWTT